MHESSLELLHCVRCKNKLELENIEENKEIIEGFLICYSCSLTFPIISKTPILWDDFSAYLSPRVILGGQLLHNANSIKMKKFVKKSLSSIKKNIEDRTWIEKKWVDIYENNLNSRFYQIIKKIIKEIKKSEFVLEHGCSIGIISKILSQHNELVFGIDSSYSSIAFAKNSYYKNLDFFVADSLNHPFGNKKFGLVVALNLLDIIEPSKLLKIISQQVHQGSILISDPYDYERGVKSVKHPISEKKIRMILRNFDFKLSRNTSKPSYIPWNLKLNSRTILNYKVDVILGKKL